MTHKGEYKCFVKDKKNREEIHKKKGIDVKLQQITLASIVERHKSYSALETVILIVSLSLKKPSYKYRCDLHTPFTTTFCKIYFFIEILIY